MAGASCETPRGSHSSGTTLARRLKQPTRIAGPKTGLELLPRYPYSALLPVGFALPLPSPEARCALAAPFHPYPPPPFIPPPQAGESGVGEGGTFSVALSLRSLPLARRMPRRTLSGTVSPWSPDFPRRLRAAAARPTDVQEMRCKAPAVKGGRVNRHPGSRCFAPRSG